MPVFFMICLCAICHPSPTNNHSPYKPKQNSLLICKLFCLCLITEHNHLPNNVAMLAAIVLISTAGFNHLLMPNFSRIEGYSLGSDVFS